jgi:hypothetical protein
MKEIRATSGIVGSCWSLVGAVPNRELIDRAVLHDEEDAGETAAVFARQLKPGWRSRCVLKPTKCHLRPPQRTPPALFNRVEECVGERLRYQRSSQIKVLITAMSAPAPAAATPLRNDSFFETREKKLERI